ncbi:MAG: LysR family transcriptional regulator [Proteobacteria bacterium]|nr:LysR family transcriptional regulator [Pseudomonadota bacterium]
MDTYKIQYFLAAARSENLHKAAVETRSSAPAISKAIKSLEEELGTKLFQRSGRNIKLTGAGEHLQIRGNEILDLMHSVKHELSDSHRPKKFRIAGREFLLAEFGLKLLDQLKLSGTTTQIELIHCSGEDAMQM